MLDIPMKFLTVTSSSGQPNCPAVRTSTGLIMQTQQYLMHRKRSKTQRWDDLDKASKRHSRHKSSERVPGARKKSSAAPPVAMAPQRTAGSRHLEVRDCPPLPLPPSHPPTHPYLAFLLMAATLSCFRFAFSLYRWEEDRMWNGPNQT